MTIAVVNWTACRSCAPCSARLACKLKALVKLDPDEPAFIDRDRCRGCGVCLPACPYQAITMGIPAAGQGAAAGRPAA